MSPENASSVFTPFASLFKFKSINALTTLPLETSSSLFPVPLQGFESTSLGERPELAPLYAQISVQFISVDDQIYFATTVKFKLPFAFNDNPFRVIVFVPALYVAHGFADTNSNHAGR